MLRHLIKRYAVTRCHKHITQTIHNTHKPLRFLSSNINNNNNNNNDDIQPTTTTTDTVDPVTEVDIDDNDDIDVKADDIDTDDVIANVDNDVVNTEEIELEPGIDYDMHAPETPYTDINKTYVPDPVKIDYSEQDGNIVDLDDLEDLDEDELDALFDNTDTINTSNKSNDDTDTTDKDNEKQQSKSNFDEDGNSTKFFSEEQRDHSDHIDQQHDTLHTYQNMESIIQQNLNSIDTMMQSNTTEKKKKNKNKKNDKNDTPNNNNKPPPHDSNAPVVYDQPLQLPTYKVHSLQSQRTIDFESMRRAPGYVAQEETYEQYQQRLQSTVEKYKSRGFDFERYQNYLQYRDDRFFEHEHDWISEEIDAAPDYERIAFLDAQQKLRKEVRVESTKLLLLFPYWDHVTSQRHSRRTYKGKLESFSTLIVGGDGNGLIGFGLGKAASVPEAEEKAKLLVRKNLIFIPLYESRTISHSVIGKYHGTLVRLYPRPRGAGLKCNSGLVYNILRAAGIRDATCEFIKHRAHPRHQVYALFDAMSQSIAVRDIAIGRSMTPYQLATPGHYTPRPATIQEKQERSTHVAELLKTMVLDHMYDPIDDLEDAKWESNTEIELDTDYTGRTRKPVTKKDFTKPFNWKDTSKYPKYTPMETNINHSNYATPKPLI